MKGSYTEIVRDCASLKKIAAMILSSNVNILSIERFCDDGEGVVNRYHVYKICTDTLNYVLKRSDQAEIAVYEKLSQYQDLSVPLYYGSCEYHQQTWILIEYLSGNDLRDFTKEMSYACAESLSHIMNATWQDLPFSEKDQQRFDKYWKRISKRALCLEKEPVLKEAYQSFMQRQQTCPRTLCNGDFLQFNGIFHQHKVYLIDWAFGGNMPYSLDIARLIAHGSENKSTFPFYMNDAYRILFITKLYELLTKKPDFERYMMDIKLSLLNEYIEFIENELNNVRLERDAVFNYYYEHALFLAKQINAASKVLS